MVAISYRLNFCAYFSVTHRIYSGEYSAQLWRDNPEQLSYAVSIWALQLYRNLIEIGVEVLFCKYSDFVERLAKKHALWSFIQNDTFSNIFIINSIIF